MFYIAFFCKKAIKTNDEKSFTVSRWYTVKNSIFLKLHRIGDKTLINMGVKLLFKVTCATNEIYLSLL